MDHVKFFKGCLPQILLGPVLNTLSQNWIAKDTVNMDKGDDDNIVTAEKPTTLYFVAPVIFINKQNYSVKCTPSGVFLKDI